MSQVTNKFKVLVLLVVACVASAAMAASASANTTFNVTRTDDPAPGNCDVGDCSLREAVIAANNTPGLDTVMLAPTTYSLANPTGCTADGCKGDLDVTENLDVKVNAPGGATINGNGNTTGDRVLEIHSGGTSLYDVTVAGGVAPADADGNARGGGVRVEGAFYMYGGKVAGNTATDIGDLGGGIYNEGHTVLRRTELVGNQAENGFAGAIMTAPNGNTEVRDSKFFDNLAEFGGTLATLGDPAQVFVQGSQISFSRATALGGAVYANGGNLSFVNATINNNAAPAAGAMRVRDADVTFLNSTITRNNGDIGGIAAKNDSGHTTSIKFADTILAQNKDTDTSDGTQVDCFDDDAPATTHFQSQGYNILGQVNACGMHSATGDHLGTSVSPVDALLDPSDHFNGGPLVRAFTDAPLAGSLAINGGDPNGGCSVVDARGVPRSTGGRCDIGAYEQVSCRGTIVNRVGTFGDDLSSTTEMGGTTGNDGFEGYDGNDQLSGLDGKDAICAGPGNDTLRGGPGNDILVGGSGQDTCIGGPGKDIAIGCEVEKSIP